MSKELEALKEIDKVVPYLHLSNEYKIIETALKRLDELETAFGVLLRENEKVRKELSKEIEILEIINNKSINLDHLKHSRDYNEYNALCEYHTSISGKEYDLLKEVLK